MHEQVHLNRGTGSHYDIRCFDLEVSLPDCPATAVSLGWVLARRGPGRRTVLLRYHKQRDHSCLASLRDCQSVLGERLRAKLRRTYASKKSCRQLT